MANVSFVKLRKQWNDWVLFLHFSWWFNCWFLWSAKHIQSWRIKPIRSWISTNVRLLPPFQPTAPINGIINMTVKRIQLPVESSSAYLLAKLYRNTNIFTYERSLGWTWSIRSLKFLYSYITTVPMGSAWHHAHIVMNQNNKNNNNTNKKYVNNSS